MVSAKGTSQYNKCCSRIPALGGAAGSDTHLALPLELQDLLVSTTQAEVRPISSPMLPMVGSCHFPMVQGVIEEEQGEPLSRLIHALGTQSRPL